jgi:hypothetical protein
LEVLYGIFCIFGSSSWDWCTKSNVELPKKRKITGEASKYAQNPTSIFRKCTKSHDWLQIMHKIPRWSSENAQDLLLWFCAFLEVPRWILCIFGRSTWECVYLRGPRGIVYILEVPPWISDILWVSSKNVKNHMKHFQNAKHPIRNFQKCTRCF